MYQKGISHRNFWKEMVLDLIRISGKIVTNCRRWQLPLSLDDKIVINTHRKLVVLWQISDKFFKNIKEHMVMCVRGALQWHAGAKADDARKGRGSWGHGGRCGERRHGVVTRWCGSCSCHDGSVLHSVAPMWTRGNGMACMFKRGGVNTHTQ